MKPTSEDACSRMKKEFRFFSFLTQADLQDLAPYFACRQIASGETLWNEGDPGDFEAFIASGRVEVKKDTEFEGKEVVVGVYGQGAIVGELCLLDACPRSVSAVALEDTSLLILTRENLDKLTQSHPELSVKLLKGVLLAASIRLRKSFARLASIF